MNVLFANGVADAAELKVAINHLQHFLLLEEHGPLQLHDSISLFDEISTTNTEASVARSVPSVVSKLSYTKTQLKGEEIGISVQNLTCKWTNDPRAETLSNISFSVKASQTLAIIG